MRTVCGLGRRVQRLLGRRRPVPVRVAVIRPLAGARRPLVSDRLGEQRRGGARLDQVDGTTCGSAVLVALAAWADPDESLRLDGELGADQPPAGSIGALSAAAGFAAGFGARFDARQQQVHRESTRFWPRALGTSPWGMVAWLRRNVPAAGPYRVRLVDDSSPTDLDDAIDRTAAALAAGRPVPLLIGGLLPRHYVLALATDKTGWRVYEPGGGQVCSVTLDQLRGRELAPILGFARWHAVLLPG